MFALDFVLGNKKGSVVNSTYAPLSVGPPGSIHVKSVPKFNQLFFFILKAIPCYFFLLVSVEELVSVEHAHAHGFRFERK